MAGNSSSGRKRNESPLDEHILAGKPNVVIADLCGVAIGAVNVRRNSLRKRGIDVPPPRTIREQTEMIPRGSVACGPNERCSRGHKITFKPCLTCKVIDKRIAERFIREVLE